jgi:type IV secretory pathway VirJ component
MARLVALLVAAAVVVSTPPVPPETREAVSLRGQQQWLHIYGSSRGDPVIVSSGDGGWIHLAPHVAEVLAAHQFYVIGFDVRAYLSAFTSAPSALRVEDEPGDYRVLTQRAKQTTGKTPILIGVSEGAGLSVLAAADPVTKANIAGVIGLGLPDVNELGWRWRDMAIYVTHAPPKEPAFSAAAIAARVAPVPLAAIHATHDEFVSVAEVGRVLNAAAPPKRLWLVNASNHRFSDNLSEFDQRLLDAIAWIKANSPR